MNVSIVESTEKERAKKRVRERERERERIYFVKPENIFC